MVVFFSQDIGKSPESETSFVGRLFEKAKKLPDSVPQAIRAELATLSSEINGGNEELKRAKKEDAEKLLIGLKEKARTGMQKYAREGKTAELKNNNKYEKILANAKSFDDIRAGDVLKLRSTGENIANFLLTNDEGDEIDLTGLNAESYKNKQLLVNFGTNQSINASIGLADILPYEVSQVEVTKPNGQKVIGNLGYGNGRGRSRMGYYGEDGKYIPIYNGYAIKILQTKNITTEEKAKYDTVAESWSEKIRINEMLLRRDQIGEKYKDEFTTDEDKKLYPKVDEAGKNREARRNRMREAYGVELGRERFIQLFGKYLNEVCKKYDVPPNLILQLFQHESNFNFQAKNPRSSAYGFGQIIDTTWSRITSNILPSEELDRDDPKDQILGSVALLSHIKKSQSITWARAGVLYHTGEGLLDLPKSRIDHYLSINAAEIRQNFRGSSNMSDREYAEAYAKAAESYYKFSDISETSFVPLSIPETSQFALNGFVSHSAEIIDGMTYCARSAFKNMQEFGIIPPLDDAVKIRSHYSSSPLNLNELLNSKEYNLADVVLDSNTPNGSKFGHRATALKGKDNIWYVLDPYPKFADSNLHGTKPIPLDVYLANYPLGNPNPRFFVHKATNWLAKEILA